MKRPWHYQNGCWTTTGTVNQKELDDWAAFYGHTFQEALALADKGKIPMWFTYTYASNRCLRANRQFCRVLIEELTRCIYDPLMRAANWIDRIGRA